MCDESIVIPFGSLAVMSLDIISGVIVVVDSVAGCIFTPESAISSVFLPGEFGGVLIQFIKLILGLLLLMLLIISPNRHLHPLSLPPSCFLWYASYL